MLTRRGAVVGALLLGAAWQLGQAAYIPAKAWLAQRLIAAAWARSLHSGAAQRPWDWADTHPVARLRVPELGVELYVLEGDSLRTLAFGPGHRAGTALPGEAGVSLISGHRDTHFRFLEDLRQGMRIEVQDIDGRRQAYRVVDRRVVQARAPALPRYGDDNYLVLSTCYPFHGTRPGTPLRYAVSARALP